MNCRQRGSTVGRLGLLLLVLAGCATPAVAQNSLLQANLESAAQSMRTQGPVVVVWRLRSAQTGILRGNLIASVVDEGELLSQVTTEELILSPGEQSIRMMLPAVDSSHSGGRFAPAEIRLQFRGPDLRMNLGKFPMRVPTQWERSFTIAVCSPWEGRVPSGLQPQLDALRFETYLAKSGNRPEGAWTTVTSQFRPRELSSEPLGYCGFNLLVLAREGLGELQVDQLDAITDWVHAGGSLWVQPESMVLGRVHADFLERLTGSGVGLAPHITDAAGRVLWEAREPHRRVRYGLGRVVLIPGGEPTAPSDVVDFRRSLAFVWNVQADDSAVLESSGNWLIPQSVSSTQHWMRQQFRSVRPQENQLAPESLESGDQLLGRLIPRTMRLLPMWLVGLILMGYVLLIGPVDYFGLGLLRQRKWTWVLFPAVTLAVTLATVKLSHWYMGNTDSGKIVVVADVGRDGRLARSSSFRLRVSGTERTMETQVVGGIFSTIDFRRFGTGGWYNSWVNTQQGRNTDDNAGSGAPRLEGRVPSHYVVRQFLPQWSPRLNRELHIERWEARSRAEAAASSAGDSTGERPTDTGRASQLEFDWAQFEDAGKFNPTTIKSAGPANSTLTAAVDAIPDLLEAIVMTGTERLPVGRRRTSTFVNEIALQQNAYNPYGYGSGAIAADEFLKDICVHSGGGMYDVISRLQPHGGGDFEDLPLLDPTNPGEWLLVLCQQRGEETIIWRKLYTGGGN